MKLENRRKKTEKYKAKKKKKWYTPKINTNIYARGLPGDIDIDLMDEFFSKAGIIRLDFKTGEKKIKLYKDD